MKRRAVLSLDNELLRSERELRAEGFCWIAGVDEAGRGPLAGPVTAGAVILPLNRKEGLPGVFDSKQLSAQAREELYEEREVFPTDPRLDNANSYQRLHHPKLPLRSIQLCPFSLQWATFLLISYE